MSTTMKAAIHLGENNKDNLFSHKNTNFEALRTLVDITQKLILNQKHEIRHVSTIEWKDEIYFGTYDKVIKFSKAKVYVYSESVLCPGKMHRHPDAMVKWADQLQHSQSSNEYKELSGIDGEPFEFKWAVSQDTLQWKFSARFR